MRAGFRVDPSNVGAEDFYVYGNTISSIAAAAQATSQISIDSDSNFFAVKLNFFASIAGAVQTADTRVIPLITIQITDGGSGRNLLNTPLPLSIFMGYGELPGILPINRVFRGNSTVTFTFSNFSAATTYRLDFGLVGVKRFG